jgi:hypothetical protein
MHLLGCVAVAMFYAMSVLPLYLAIGFAILIGATILYLKRPRKKNTGVFVGRVRTVDISFLAQSPIGFIGRMTRSVPAPRVFPEVNDAANPVASYGLAAMGTNTNTMRSLLASDAGASGIDAIIAAPFPIQQTTGGLSAPLNALTAIPSGVLLDGAREGSTIVYCNSAQSQAANKKSPVFAWCAVSTGTHIQGGFETAGSAAIASAPNGGNTGTGTVTAGPTAAAGVVENGAYSVLFTDATHFDVIAPDGSQLKAGQTGVAYADGGIGFTITAGGTAFVAGDGFTMTVTYSTIPVEGAYFNGPGDATGAIELVYNLL